MFGKKNPKADPYSIGNLLVLAGYCSEADIDAAAEFQKTNPDVLMGEHLVHKGLISEEVLEIMVIRQKAARGQNSAILKFAKLATQKTQRVSATLDDLVTEKSK